MKRQAQSRVSVLLALVTAGVVAIFVFGEPSTTQILAAEAGRGRTQARGGEIIELVPGGRPVFAPAGLVHWHGASPDEHVVQLTILGGGDGGPTSWMEPVSEEDYRGQ